MLSVTLGPGLLGQVYDGLQNPLELLAISYGSFLPRGVDLPALDPNSKWSFVPTVQQGDRLRAGDTIGTVQEGRFTHKIMIPFAEALSQESIIVSPQITELELAPGQKKVFEVVVAVVTGSSTGVVCRAKTAQLTFVV